MSSVGYTATRTVRVDTVTNVPQHGQVLVSSGSRTTLDTDYLTTELDHTNSGVCPDLANTKRENLTPSVVTCADDMTSAQRSYDAIRGPLRQGTTSIK